MPPSRVILNPGRSGCLPSVTELLDARRTATLAYLSCDPESLARDLARFVAGGFTVERVLPIDMMPQTDQTEVLALLRGSRRTARA